MTQYVYILSDYNEDGAKNVCATLDRGRLLDMVDKNWGTLPGSSADIPATLEARQRQADFFAKWRSEAKAGLTKMLDESDEDLAERTENEGAINCMDGWGGMQLHVVVLR